MCIRDRLYTVGILKTLPGIRKYVAIDGGMSDNIRTALYHADYEPTIARTVVLNALAAGKNVVTANKALMATHGKEVMRCV